MINPHPIYVVGGGAAGIFGAIQLKKQLPAVRVIVLEQSNKLLSKVRVSGGGRCNVTHNLFHIGKFASKYPRGEKLLKKLFTEFSSKDIVDWFKNYRVELKAESDGRMFPKSNTSQTIIDCLLNESNRLGIEFIFECKLQSIQKNKENSMVGIQTSKGFFDTHNVLIASGGTPSKKGLAIYENLGHHCEVPVPSLFTFNIKDDELVKLSGVSMNEVSIRVGGLKLKESGPLLITHWGLSGPAVLKLSAWGARELYNKAYIFSIFINLTSTLKEVEVEEFIKETVLINPKKLVKNTPLFDIPTRFWEYLLYRSKIKEAPWNQLSSKHIKALTQHIFALEFEVNGKSTFKEEFVTCGGIPLNEINHQTLESKFVKGVYFAGELLDIDGVTGGFNFQAAWTTSWIAANAIAKTYQNDN